MMLDIIYTDAHNILLTMFTKTRLHAMLNNNMSFVLQLSNQ